MASVAQAAKLTGMRLHALYLLYRGGFIEGTQASPCKILLDVASLSKHIEESKVPGYWTRERVQRYETSVRD